MAKEKVKYTVIRDSREKISWNFIKSESCNGTQTYKLDIADYSLLGLEEVFLVERKHTPSELAGNLSAKDSPRFHRELNLLNKVKHPYVVMAFTLESFLGFPWSDDSLPVSVKRRIKIGGKYLMYKLLELYDMYPNIQFVFAGDAAKDFVSILLKKYSKLYLQ